MFVCIIYDIWQQHSSSSSSSKPLLEIWISDQWCCCGCEGRNRKRLEPVSAFESRHQDPPTSSQRHSAFFFWIFYARGTTMMQSGSSSVIWNACMQFEIAKVHHLETQMQQIRGCDSANVARLLLNSSPADFAGLDFSRPQQRNPEAKSDSKKWQQSGKKKEQIPEKQISCQRFNKGSEMILEDNDMMRIHPMSFMVSRLSMWLKHYSNLTKLPWQQDRGLIKEHICSFKGLKKVLIHVAEWISAGRSWAQGKPGVTRGIDPCAGSLGKLTLTWT